MKVCKLLCITENNNNKYYNMTSDGSTISVLYGRVGATEQTASYPDQKWNSLVNSKIKKGYKDVTHLFAEDVSDKIDFIDIEDLGIRNLISLLQGFTRQSVKTHYDVTSESVTKKQVDTAQEIINNLLICKDIKCVNGFLLDLYTIIPRRMSNVRNYLLTSFEQESFNRFISKEQDILDSMASSIQTLTLEKENKDTKVNLLDAMGIEISGVTDSKTISLIKNKLQDISNKFDSCYSVVNKKTRMSFDTRVSLSINKETELLWHGSRNQNWISILQNGLLIRPSNAVYTGSAFGDGIYAADKSLKSFGYTDGNGSYWARGNSNVAFMGLYDFHIGKQYKTNRSDSSLSESKLKKLGDFDSTFAMADSKGFLKNNEYIVYSKDACDIKYLVKLKG